MSCRLPFLVSLLGLGLLGGVGCGVRPAPEPASWVARVSTLQEQAEQALRTNDSATAQAALKEMAEGPMPVGVSSADLRVVRQDAYYRLSQLELRQGDLDRARQWAERGLSLGQSTDLFTANLLVARGHLGELEGRDAEAVSDYHAALLINEALLDQLQASDGGAP